MFEVFDDRSNHHGVVNVAHIHSPEYIFKEVLFRKSCDVIADGPKIAAVGVNGYYIFLWGRG